MGRLFSFFLAGSLAACTAGAWAAPPHKAHRRAPAKGVHSAAHHAAASHPAWRRAGHGGHRTSVHPHAPAPHLRSATLRERAASATPDPPAAEPAVEAAPASLRIPKVSVPPLRGSRESLVRQNEKIETEGLERIEDADDLNDRIARKLLVPVPESPGLSVNASLPEQLRYCRPWTANFLSDLAKAHEAAFHRPVIVSSAVRTVEYQKELEKVNGNAAPAEGDIVSPHLTGGTIDIAKSDLPRQELSWMRAWLKPLQEAGKIDVEEEFQQACFHITVYQNYVPPLVEAARKPGARPRAKRRHLATANALAVRAM